MYEHKYIICWKKLISWNLLIFAIFYPILPIMDPSKNEKARVYSKKFSIHVQMLIFNQFLKCNRKYVLLLLFHSTSITGHNCWWEDKIRWNKISRLHYFLLWLAIYVYWISRIILNLLLYVSMYLNVWYTSEKSIVMLI